MKSTATNGAAGEEQAQDPVAASAAESKDEPACCEAGCACNAPAGGKGVKIVVSLLVLAAVVGILIYRGASTAAPSASPPVQKPTFAVDQNAAATAPETVPQPAAVAAPEVGVAPAAVTVQPNEQKVEQPPAAKTPERIGVYLESLAELNNVALSQDAVFIFIPSEKNEAVQGKTADAVLAAQSSLKRNNITLGLYTLSTGSADYAGIGKQVQAPAILIVTKGRGMAAVSGEVTESKLLQAFMATTRAGGCGPSGCGPASPGCK